MASGITIYSLYKLSKIEVVDEYLLLRTEQPSYSNANQNQENEGFEIEQQKRKFLLNSYIDLNAKNAEIEFIGELQLPPIGEKLYAEKGLFKLPIFYQQIEYGKHWIILGSANTIVDFEKELADDDDLLSLKPIGAIMQVDATFITENDFDLSSIKNYDAKDMRDL